MRSNKKRTLRASGATKAGIADMVTTAVTGPVDGALYRVMDSQTYNLAIDATWDKHSDAMRPIRTAMHMDVESGTRQKEGEINENT